MTDWDSATDPVQPARKREEVLLARARARWQRSQAAITKSGGMVTKVGKMTSLQGHESAVDPSFDEDR